MLIDSHCHLDFDAFADDFDAVLHRAHAAGVDKMLTISTRIREFDKIRALADAHNSVFCSIGTHPHNADEELAFGVEDIVRLAQHPKVIGIGETGLDYFYDNAPRIAQRDMLLRHIEACRQTGLPLIIHNRSSDEDMASILTGEMKKGAFKLLFHCFSGSRELAETGLELGAYFSFSGIVTFKNAQDLRDILADIPLERLLVETDAPYLAPMPYRGKRNEPAFVIHTAQAVANVKNVDMKEFSATSTENFYRLFDKSR